MRIIKWVIITLFPFFCNAEVSISQEKMQQRTLEALAKFYGLDIIGQETARRVQEKYLPEPVKKYGPFFITWAIMIRDQKIVYRSTF